MTVIRSRAARFLLASILVFYGVVTLSGPALHGLPGLGHRSSGWATEQATAPGHGEHDGTTVHDCPICHFHTQGQLSTGSDGGACIELLLDRAVEEPQLPRACLITRPSSPRAPPLS